MTRIETGEQKAARLERELAGSDEGSGVESPRGDTADPDYAEAITLLEEGLGIVEALVEPRREWGEDVAEFLSRAD